jgi:transglutaminase-like putative cysteine protease
MIEKIKNIILKKPKKSKENWLEILATTLSCWLISVGVALIVDAHYSVQIGLVTILWQTLLVTVIAFLLTRQWWIAVIYFGILIPVFFLAISLTGDIYGFFESCLGFIKWWASSMPYNSKWYSDQGFYIVHTIINFGLSLLFFVVARITKKPWIVVVLAFLFVIENYIKGYTNYSPFAIPFLLIGIFPLIAAEKFMRLKHATSKNQFGLWGKKWVLMATSTLMAVLVLVASFGVASNFNPNTRTRFSSNVVADFQTATNTFTKEQQKHNITLFDFGLVTNSTYIGGNLYSIKPEVIATTNLTESVLVKKTSFDTFDGKNWVIGFKTPYRINGIWQEEQNTYLSSPLINNKKYLSAVKRIAYNQSINIKMEGDSNYFFTVGQVVKFTENTPTENPISFDELGRIVSLYGQKKGYSYTIDTLIYDTNDKSTKTQIKALLKDYAGIKDAFCNKNNPLYRHYTTPFENQPKEVAKIVKSLNLKNKNSYEKAYKICQYFVKGNGFEYTDKPPAFRESDNIISKLLTDKKGHCLYYSTAMVAFARQAGIPARLAAGYRTIESEKGKTQVIDKSSPYAWVECYIENMGWIPFDPSPVVKTKPNLNKNEGDNDNNSDSNVHDGKVDHEFQDSKSKYLTKIIVNLLVILLIALAVIIVVLLVLNTILSQKAYELEKVKKRFKSTSQQAEFYYQDILRQFGWLGFSSKAGETIKEWAQRVNSSVRAVDNTTLLETIAIIEALHYADRTPTETQVAEIWRLRKAFERMLKRKNNAVMYTIKRRLLLPVITKKVKKYK